MSAEPESQSEPVQSEEKPNIVGWSTDPSAALTESLASVRERIDEILEEARSAAEGIQAEADRHLKSRQAEAEKLYEERAAEAEKLYEERTAEAQSLYEQRTADAERMVGERVDALSALSVSIVDRVAALASQADGLAVEVSESLERMRELTPTAQPTAGASAVRGEAQPGGAPTHESAAESAPEPAATGESSDGDDGPSEEDAVLLATQLAAAGKDRAEIEAELRAQLGLEEPGPIADKVIG